MFYSIYKTSEVVSINKNIIFHNWNKYCVLAKISVGIYNIKRRAALAPLMFLLRITLKDFFVSEMELEGSIWMYSINVTAA